MDKAVLVVFKGLRLCCRANFLPMMDEFHAAIYPPTSQGHRKLNTYRPDMPQIFRLDQTPPTSHTP